jgi:S1-C subfamily serine protease
VLPSVPSTALGQAVRDSKIISWLDDTLPPTTSIVGWLENSFEQTKIPEIVSELEPRTHNTKTAVPDISDFQDIVQTSRSSVVEIEGRSCKGIGVGSGFIVAPNYIATNAHVVAGMRTPYIQDVNGRHRAEIVAFDPSNDIAILKTNRLEGTSLTLVDNLVPVGESGVALGFPGGKSFTAQPAVVIEHFTALGRDIYNDHEVRRDVYALKSTVEPGNSGGPLIDTSGNVMGVIFARSTAHEGVGYALSTPVVKRLLQKAQSQPSSTGSIRCTS